MCSSWNFSMCLSSHTHTHTPKLFTNNTSPFTTIIPIRSEKWHPHQVSSYFSLFLHLIHIEEYRTKVGRHAGRHTTDRVMHTHTRYQIMHDSLVKVGQSHTLAGFFSLHSPIITTAGYFISVSSSCLMQALWLRMVSNLYPSGMLFPLHF